MSSNDELSSDTSSSCDVELLQLAVEGEGSFKDVRAQKFPRTDFFKTLTAGRK